MQPQNSQLHVPSSSRNVSTERTRNKRDTRPIHDKKWQTEQTAKVCRGYNNIKSTWGSFTKNIYYLNTYLYLQISVQKDSEYLPHSITNNKMLKKIHVISNSISK